MSPRIKSGVRKRRAKRPVEKNVVKGYDSNWEYELHTGILKDWVVHTEQSDYIVEHTYHPDFIRSFGNKKIYLEAKGRFWDYAEHNKYVWIKKALPKNVEFVFLFAMFMHSLNVKLKLNFIHLDLIVSKIFLLLS